MLLDGTARYFKHILYACMSTLISLQRFVEGDILRHEKKRSVILVAVFVNISQQTVYVS